MPKLILTSDDEINRWLIAHGDSLASLTRMACEGFDITEDLYLLSATAADRVIMDIRDRLPSTNGTKQ